MTLCYSEKVGENIGGPFVKASSRLIILISATLGLLLFFQNCGPQDLTGGVNPEDPFELPSHDSRLDELPFPYQISFSTLTFMSCTNIAEDSPGNFNFKLTADTIPGQSNATSIGLGLRQEFRTALDQYLSTLPESQKAQAFRDALALAKNSKNMEPYIAYVETNQIRSVTTSSGRPLIKPIFSRPLSNAGYVERFLFNFGAATYRYIIPVSPDLDIPIRTGRAVATSLHVPTNNDASPDVFIQQEGARSVVVGFGDFTNGRNTRPARHGAVDMSTNDVSNNSDLPILGKRYSLSFSRPIGNESIYGDRSVVQNVAEIDLHTGNPTVAANWLCPIRLKVVRSADRYNPIYIGGVIREACPQQPASALLLPDYNQKLQFVQKLLPPDQFDVNVVHNCVVPKVARCYGNTNTVVYDEDFFETTDTNITPPQYKGCGIEGQPRCPHYVTICYKN